MKTYNNPVKETHDSGALFEFSASLRSELNLLIVLHVLFFALYCIIDWNDLLTLPWADGTVGDHIHNSLAISSRAQNWPFNWTTSLFTHQFVHIRAGELLLSTSMLWLFGHMLKKRVGQRRVIVFYFATSFISALAFNLSHLVFPIFSNPGGAMEGAFGGVLAVMSASVILYGRHRFHIGKHVSFHLWQVYVSALLLSFAAVYKHNMAYVLVYACNIYMGMKYATFLEVRAMAEVKGNVDLILQKRQ